MTTRRDTDVLLARLRVFLAAMPTVGSLSIGCVAQDPAGAPAARAEPERKTVAHESPDSSVHASNEQPPAPRPGTPAEHDEDDHAGEGAAGSSTPEAPPLPGYLVGDPPYVEGYNPEEDPCVTGDWCGPRGAIEALALARAGEELGCPSKITASSPSAREVDGSAKVYRGLSLDRSMQGTFKPWYTAREREERKVEDLCCYHWFEYCSGRVLIDNGEAITARLQPSTGEASWSVFDLLLPEAWEQRLDAGVRHVLAEAWKRDALAEHASIASFARATLELLAVGAPADLVDAAAQAGLDEIVHTRACLALAARYGALRLEPTSLVPPPPRESTLERLIADTFREACVGETVAALRAQRQRRECASPALRRVLEQIAEDEARHAALGWATVRWAVIEAGASGRRALIAALDEMRDMRSGAIAEPIGPEIDPSTLLACGRLTAEIDAEVRAACWNDIIEPMVRELLA